MKNRIDKKRELTVAILEDNHGDFVLMEDFLIEKFKMVEINRCETFNALRNLINDEVDFNLILLDLHLPDSSGLELINQILSLKIDAPIIVLTGYSDIELAKESLKLGIDDFLIKDEITPSILSKSIEFAFSRSEYVMHIEDQNKKLKDIAWTQSHVVRAPLSRILGIVNLIETEPEINEELKFLLKQLRVSSNEMDTIIRKITEEAQEIHLSKNNE